MMMKNHHYIFFSFPNSLDIYTDLDYLISIYIVLKENSSFLKLDLHIYMIQNIGKQINLLNNKLKNKAYLKKAPKEIVQNDKKIVKELTVEDEKLRSIVSSIN